MQSGLPKIHILFAHPFPHRSRLNRALIEAIRELERVEIVDLYETYPDFHIAVKHEQQRLSEADLVVFQHPIYWYSAPALLKQWQDVVLAEGFALGEGGTALHGKDFMSAVTVGHSESAYQTGGYDRFPIEVFLRPYEQMALHSGMNYLSPFVVYNAPRITEGELEARAGAYHRRLLRYLEGAGDG